jgi:phosphoribosylformimino-5-aminoimidazole carboxamide ribotide isomerase
MPRRFQVIPAVDVLADEAVRLEQGDFQRVALRLGDPVAVVRRFVDAGARMIHIVDLDGARTGRVRPQLVARLAAAASPARIQASGGIRSLADAELLLAAGAVRVVVGTAAFAEPGALERYADALGDRLVVAVDARRGRVAVEGWERDASLSAAEAAARCATAGVRRILCTAIERDGTLRGPDLGLLRRVRRFGVPVLAAGGIASPGDVGAVARAGCEGVIVGRALLDGRLPLQTLHSPVWPAARRRDHAASSSQAASGADPSSSPRAPQPP